MAKDALTVLREARELISDPKRWTQGEYARDLGGDPCDQLDTTAACWCSEGAVRRACGISGDSHSDLFNGAWLLISGASDGQPIRINDREGHAAVLRMFDAAIASAEAEAQS